MDQKSSPPPAPRRDKRLLLAAGIFFALAIGQALRIWWPGPDPARVEAWEKVAPRIEQAEQAGTAAAEKRLEEVRAFFAERKSRAPEFAKAALGLKGKFYFVKGKFAGDDGASHREYLRECFEKHVFTTEELRGVVEGAVAGFVSDAKAAENLLLAEIQADLADTELCRYGSMPELRSLDKLQKAYERMVEAVLPVLSRDLGVTVGREAVTWIAADIGSEATLQLASAIAARLGISGGILSTGAASAVETVGLGLVVGLVMDYLVDFILKEAGYDPVQDVAERVQQCLDNIEAALIGGVAEVTPGHETSGQASSTAAERGLREELQALHLGQSRLRREALQKLILHGAR